MSLSNPRKIFGVHSLTTYDPLTGIPYGMARVIKGSTVKMTGNVIELKGGSNRFAWDAEDGDISCDLGFGVSEYPDWLFTLFGGKAPTDGAAEPTGGSTSVVNKKGTSIVAATGILAALTLTAADLKTGRYVLVATSATALAIYCMSNIDFGRGTLEDFLDDTLKVGTFTGVSTGSTVLLTGFGITVTGGASATAFVVGDTATFEIRAANTYNRSVIIGGAADVFPQFGCIAYGQKTGSGAIFEIEIFKAKCIGLTLGAQRKAYGEHDYNAKAFYDSVNNGVARVREVE